MHRMHQKVKQWSRVSAKALIGLFLAITLTSCSFGYGVATQDWHPFEIAAGVFTKIVIAIF